MCETFRRSMGDAGGKSVVGFSVGFSAFRWPLGDAGGKSVVGFSVGCSAFRWPLGDAGGKSVDGSSALFAFPSALCDRSCALRRRTGERGQDWMVLERKVGDRECRVGEGALWMRLICLALE